MSGSVLVVGLGNVVQCDDGLGVHAARELLDRYSLPDWVEVIEGGTAGLLLVPPLADSRCAVLVDAIDLGAAPGTLHRLDGTDFIGGFAQRISTHDAGLVDLIGAAALAGALPEELVLLGLQPQRIGWGTELTAATAAAMPRLVAAIADQLRAWGAKLAAREGVAA